MKQFNLRILVLIFLIGAGSLYSQTSASSEKAIIYIYALPTTTTLGRIKPSVFIDDKEVAQIRPGRFFIATVQPGTHVVRFKDSKKRGGIEMEFQAGQTYYLRVNWKAEGTVRPQGFDMLQKEAAQYDVKQSKPIDDENIKDKTVVTTRVP